MSQSPPLPRALDESGVEFFLSSSGRARTEAGNEFANIPVMRASRRLPIGTTIDVSRRIGRFFEHLPPSAPNKSTESRAIFTAYVCFPYADANASLLINQRDHTWSVQLVANVDPFEMITVRRAIGFPRTFELETRPLVEVHLRKWFKASIVNRNMPSSVDTFEVAFKRLRTAVCGREQHLMHNEQVNRLQVAGDTCGLAAIGIMDYLWRGLQPRIHAPSREPPSIYSDEDDIYSVPPRERMLAVEEQELIDDGVTPLEVGICETPEQAGDAVDRELMHRSRRDQQQQHEFNVSSTKA